MGMNNMSLLLPCECAEKRQYSKHFGALRLVQQHIGVTQLTGE
jgi:hypothetical protein